MVLHAWYVSYSPVVEEMWSSEFYYDFPVAPQEQQNYFLWKDRVPVAFTLTPWATIGPHRWQEWKGSVASIKIIKLLCSVSSTRRRRNNILIGRGQFNSIESYWLLQKWICTSQQLNNGRGNSISQNRDKAIFHSWLFDYCESTSCPLNVFRASLGEVFASIW